MALTDGVCDVHKICSGISTGINPKRCADVREWLEHRKQMNVIHFECERRDVAIALNYFKQTYTSKMTAEKAEKPLG